ncbi:hypothetical protein [Reyranella sp. CPCC 100927]|uniref:hypothetical protein n=1 Tax=Reyranella sp. CPCC 100927 TaxID=2599616 RepID=UPI0011B847A6|nr:hypothetical protein [Reyranella sp. CPCC 100927]TWT02035.1 hypothetical protein FQU96_31130 [Reyranella sp. CPCC 100927]
MSDVISRLGCRYLGGAAAAAMVAVVLSIASGGSRETLAQGPSAKQCPGVSDLLTVSPSQEVHLDVLAYAAGALSERLRLCIGQAGSNWFDPVEEGRRQATGLMFEWVGAFGCALSEYASAPSVLGRPLSGPRVNYLREAAQLESLSGSYETEADLRSSAPLAHFRAQQLLVKIQSRWNKSTDADKAELIAREAAGDPAAAMALATLIFAARTAPDDVEKALALLAKAARHGSVKASELGAHFAGVAARSANTGDRARRYSDIERRFLVMASYRGSVDALTQLLQMLQRSDSADDVAAYGFWDVRYRGIVRDLHEIRSACR